MNSPNPHLHNLERAPYELGHLLRKLPYDFPYGPAMSSDVRQQVEAAISHARNANEALMNGMEAIGHVLLSAANNPEFPPSVLTLENLAGLIKHIAVEAQFVQEQRADLQATLDRERDYLRAVHSSLFQKADQHAAPMESAGVV